MLWPEDVKPATLALFRLLSRQHCVISSWRHIFPAEMAVSQAGDILQAMLGSSFSEKSQGGKTASESQALLGFKVSAQLRNNWGCRVVLAMHSPTLWAAAEEQKPSSNRWQAGLHAPVLGESQSLANTL